MSATFDWDEKKWNDFTKRIQRNIESAKIDRVLVKVAYDGLNTVRQAMPKKTGATRRSWGVKKHKDGYLIASASKVSLFLEEGTRAHGPKVKKFLYIPLRPGAAVWRKGFVFGRDYILVKLVKGIKAIRYLKPASNEVLKIMVDEFSQHLRKV